MKDPDQLVLFDPRYYMARLDDELSGLRDARRTNVRRDLDRLLKRVMSDPGGIFGYVAIDKPSPTFVGAWRIEYSASRPGYGPMLYDIAMGAVPGQGGLMPDRKSVSPLARKVWKYYYERRPDVTKRQIPKGSALPRFDDPAEPWLDCVYKATRVMGYGPLVQREIGFKQRVFAAFRKAGIDPTRFNDLDFMIEDCLVKAAGYFFIAQHRAMRRGER